MNTLHKIASTILLKYKIAKSKALISNKRFKDMYKGKRCFVLGNGPSLNSHDLSLLENEFVFTVNQISRHKDFKKLKTNFHFWADPIFFQLDLSKEEDKELLNKMKEVNTDNNKPICFYEYSARNLIKSTNLDSELNIHYYKCGRSFSDIPQKEINMTAFMPSFSTVVHYAIATAIYMGFSEIYFLGCESTGIISAVNIRLNENLANDYAYELSENEDKRMRKRVEKLSFEQELYGFYKIISDYKLLNKHCKKRNIKLFNCTPGGLVEGVPRVKFESLFEGIDNE